MCGYETRNVSGVFPECGTGLAETARAISTTAGGYLGWVAVLSEPSVLTAGILPTLLLLRRRRRAS